MPANLTGIKYDSFVNLEFQVHIGNSSIDSNWNDTIIERYPLRPCNESDFRNRTNEGFEWANMSSIEKNSLLCPANITNLTM